MAVDDHGIEVLKKAGEEVTPGDKSDYYIKVNDAINKAVLEAILAALGGGTGVFTDNQTTTPVILGNTLTLISTSVPASKTWSITRISVRTRSPGKFTIKHNGDVIGTGRSGPQNFNPDFLFNPGFEASATDTIVIEYNQLYGPTGVDIEGYLMAIET